MILSDMGIRRALYVGELDIEPLDTDLIQPASVDLRLGRHFRIMQPGDYAAIDPFEPREELTRAHYVPVGEPFLLHPGAFVLGCTKETVGVSSALAGRVDGKSSLGRLGLLVHSTAGFIDPGFTGQITLELANVATLPIKLWPDMPIAQISFMKLDEPAVRPYGHPLRRSKYQNQNGATPSRYSENVRV